MRMIQYTGLSLSQNKMPKLDIDTTSTLEYRDKVLYIKTRFNCSLSITSKELSVDYKLKEVQLEQVTRHWASRVVEECLKQKIAQFTHERRGSVTTMFMKEAEYTNIANNNNEFGKAKDYVLVDVFCEESFFNKNSDYIAEFADTIAESLKGFTSKYQTGYSKLPSPKTHTYEV